MYKNNLKVGTIEELRTIERVRFSYLKNRGSIPDIVEETGLPLEYIKKLVRKFKGQEIRDVSILVSNSIMQQMLFGYNQRIGHLMDTLKQIDKRTQIEVSVCCESPVLKENEKNTCSSCNLPAQIKIIDKEGLLDIKLAILEQLREEDRLMVEFATKMGFTQKEEVQPQTPVNQYNLFMGGSNKPTPEQEKILLDIRALPGLERDILAQNLLREARRMKEEEEKAKQEQVTPQEQK
jgi:hypothetical protein